MSDRSSKSALDALVRDAKQDLAPPAGRIDDAKWSAMEDRILARMAEERSPLIDEVKTASSSRARFLRASAAVLAAAAAVALVVKNDPGSARPDSAVSQTELTASSLQATEGQGEVRVGGFPVSAGHVLRAGDVVEADGARAILERPRKVTWLLEGRGDAAAVGRARVKSASESLVLGLEDGAIEAQVTPVPSGEAFAVDVASGANLVRVAVHGTHLRVARDGSHVVVDLSEGVVSIGVPPRTGSTYGTLVTAPAHIELDVTDLDHSLRVDHGAAAVRAPISLVASREVAIGSPNGAAARPETPPSRERPAEAPAAVAVATVPRPAAVPHPGVDPSRDPSRNGASKVDPSVPVLPPRAAIAAAVRDCAAQRSRPENVRVTVSSSLTLRVATGGGVETAQFSPPLLPEIQSCAATAIYKATFSDAAGTSVVIPIDFSY